MSGRRYCLISPCRNEGEYLRRTLDSVLNQSLPPTLWVVVDDGSTDDTPEILDSYNTVDINIYQENLFHTKMMLSEFDLDRYLFGVTAAELSVAERRRYERRLKREIAELYYGRNM